VWFTAEIHAARRGRCYNRDGRPRAISMDLSRLTAVGKVEGVPGIALAAAVLILGAVLGLTEALPAPWRGPLLTIVAVGALILAMLGVVGWMRSRLQIAEATGDGAEARNKDASKAGGPQAATARGKGAIAINERR
jgi:hypothetical protein